MQAELLLVLTCAGYVAPYAWDRVRTEWRNRALRVQIDSDKVSRLINDLARNNHRMLVIPEGVKVVPLRENICVQEVSRNGDVFIPRGAIKPHKCFTCGENERRGDNHFTYCMGPTCGSVGYWDENSI